jgi:hypothetical protein
VDLAVRRLGRAAHQQRVERAVGIVAGLEHPGHDVVLRCVRPARSARCRTAVLRLGVRRRRRSRAEVAGERLGEHHEVARPRPTASRARLAAGSRRPACWSTVTVSCSAVTHPDCQTGCVRTPCDRARSGHPRRRHGRAAGRRRQGVVEHARPHAARVRPRRGLDAAEVVVVGDPVPTNRPVTFTREDPPLRRSGGRPADRASTRSSRRRDQLVVLAVDMPRVTLDTIARLLDAAALRDGAVLVDPDGRRSSRRTSSTAALDGAAARRRRSTACRCTGCSAPRPRSVSRRGRRGPATSTPGRTCATSASPDAHPLAIGVRAGQCGNREPARLDRRALRRPRRRRPRSTRALVLDLARSPRTR